MSPSFGVIADRRMIKMWWLRVLTYLGAGSTILLAAAPWLGVSYQWVWLLICFVFANVGLNGAGVFYNSLLPHMGLKMKWIQYLTKHLLLVTLEEGYS